MKAAHWMMSFLQVFALGHILYIHNHSCEFLFVNLVFFIYAYQVLMEFQNMKQPKTYKICHKKTLQLVQLITSLQ